MLNDLIAKLAKTLDTKAAQVQQSSDLTADAVRELAELADSLFKLRRANRVLVEQKEIEENRLRVELLRKFRGQS